MKVNNPTIKARNQIFNKDLKKALDIASKQLQKRIERDNFIVYGPRN